MANSSLALWYLDVFACFVLGCFWFLTILIFAILCFWNVFVGSVSFLSCLISFFLLWNTLSGAYTQAKSLSNSVDLRNHYKDLLGTILALDKCCSFRLEYFWFFLCTMGFLEGIISDLIFWFFFIVVVLKIFNSISAHKCFGSDRRSCDIFHLTKTWGKKETTACLFHPTKI